MILRVVLVALLALTAGCHPTTPEECIQKYAKPGIASDVAQMAIQACINELPTPPAEPARVPPGQFDFSSPAPAEVAPHFWRDVIGALPVTTIVWGLLAYLGRALLDRRIRWHLGVPSFLVTVFGTALAYAYFGTHPAIYFVFPAVFAVLTLMPMLGAERRRGRVQ